MVEVKSVAHPPEMEDGIDYQVENTAGNRHYNFQVPERRVLVLQSVTQKVAPKKYKQIDFVEPLPEEIETGLRRYFANKFGEEIEVRYAD